jgi:predicted ATPase with chaperone activity
MARTIADLDDAVRIGTRHPTAAIHSRGLDRR